MKRFFSNKINIFVTIILVLTIGVATFFALNYFGVIGKEIIAVDFSGMNKTEVDAWVKEEGLDENSYNYSYAYDETIEKDYVVYQSVKAGEAISNGLTIVYSNGKDPNGSVDIESIIKNMSYGDIKQWFISNEYSNVSYTFETNENFEFGKVIDVTPATATKSDAITVVISYGKNIEDISTTVPDFSSYSKEEIEDWGKEYAVTVKFDYETSTTVDENRYISQNIASGKNVNGGSTVTVTLSSGKSDSNTATIPDTLLGTSESDFLAQLKKLGFTSFNKDSETYYAESLAKDTIYSYDDGTFKTSRTIYYALCAGKYSFNANDFNGKKKADVETIVANLKKHNARVDGKSVSVEFTTGEKNSSKANTVYDCSISSNTISCKVYASEDSSSATAIIPTDGRYLGNREGYFISALKELGFTNFAKSDITYYSTTLQGNTIYSYDDGEIALNKTINYALTCGAYEFEATEFIGLSTEEANSKIKSLRNRNARINGDLISISFTDGVADDSMYGKTYDCSLKNSTVACKVYTSTSGGGSTGKTATIPGNLLGYSESKFLSYVKSLGFTNFSKSSTTYYSTTLASGSVYSYDDGTFDTSKTINYALSCGPYTFNAGDYNGLSQSDATNKVASQRSRNANKGALYINFTSGTASSSKAGTTYDCSFGGNTISCYLYTNGSTTTDVEVTNYVGGNVDNFKSWCSSNGLYYSIEEQYYSGAEKGRIISQSPSSGTVAVGSYISVVVSKGPEPAETATLLSASFIKQNYKGNSYSETESLISSYLNNSGFTNYAIEGITSTSPLYSIDKIYVGGYEHTSQAEYATDASIVIQIVSKNP